MLLLCAAAALLLAGCVQMTQSWYVSRCDRDVKKATRDFGAARDDAQRSAALTRRGNAYSERIRYSRAAHIISTADYEQLFALAIKDHDQAVALDPGSAEAYLSRGQTYYDRAALEKGREAERWFQPAAADFERAVQRDARNASAFDLLGGAHEQMGNFDDAIRDYTREMALDQRLGRIRLADAYCARGGFDQKQKQSEAAIADYEKAIELGVNTDACSCDPYNPLVWLYAGVSRQYDKAWNLVHAAQRSRKWIAPEIIDKLKKDSGRAS
jgi:hypothetical protein